MAIVNNVLAGNSSNYSILITNGPTAPSIPNTMHLGLMLLLGFSLKAVFIQQGTDYP